MNAFIPRKLPSWVLCTVIGFYIAYASYEFDEGKVEEMFLNYHGNSTYIIWNQIQNSTKDIRRRMCYDVLPEIFPTELMSINSFHYASESSPRIRVERVINNATLILTNKRKVQISVVLCYFHEMQFYLTCAKDDLVFDLYREYKPENTFTLKSGMYQVHYY